MTTPAPTYDFASETQAEIVSCMMWDTNFLRRTDTLVTAEYFESDLHKVYAEIALEHWQSYKSAASSTVWVEIIRREFSKRLSPFTKEEVVGFLKMSKEIEVRDRGWLLDNIAEFAKERAIYNAFVENVSRLAKKADPDRFGKVEASMSAAFKIALNNEEEEYDFFAKIGERTEARLDLASGKGSMLGITTGVEELDGVLLHKGWGKEELSLLMGAAKASKSMMLYGFAANAVRANHNTLLITCENSRAIVAGRLDANFSRVGMSEHDTKIHEVDSKVRDADKRAHGLLEIAAYPTGTLKPSQIRRLLDTYRSKGKTFDLVVIDYLDIMQPDVRYDSPIENSKSIYVDVRAIAQEYKVAILSATQTNREGAKAATVRSEHVAEDFNRIRIADIVISINRTEDERAHGKARLYFAACRNQRDGMTLFVTQNLDQCLGISAVERIE